MAHIAPGKERAGGLALRSRTDVVRVLGFRVWTTRWGVRPASWGQHAVESIIGMHHQPEAWAERQRRSCNPVRSWAAPRDYVREKGPSVDGSMQGGRGTST
jgi:hypothetical protein